MQHLKTINDARRDWVAQRTICAIGEMMDKGERISFYSVAKRAQIARSTLYRRGDLRSLVERARAGEESLPMLDPSHPARVGELESELALVKQERDKLKRLLGESSLTSYCLVEFSAMA